MVVSTQGLIIRVNKHIESLFGYPSEELIGKKISTLIPERFHSKHSQHESSYYCHPRKRPMGVGYELYGLRRDGSEFPVDISLNPTQFHGETTVFCTIRDASGRKKIEAELYRSQKLESIGVLAAGIAQNYNNLLTCILGNVSLLMLDTSLGDENSENLLEIENASLQAKELTQKLLTFSKGGEPVKKIVSLAKLLPFLVHSCLKKESSCELVISDKIDEVNVDEGQISQVIRNLITNADEALSDSGGIRIVAENVVVDRKESDQYRQESISK